MGLRCDRAGSRESGAPQRRQRASGRSVRCPFCSAWSASRCRMSSWRCRCIKIPSWWDLDAQAQAATHRITEDIGRRCHLRQLGRLPPGQDTVSPEILSSVEPEQAFPGLVNMPMCYLERSEAMSGLQHFMSFAAGAEAEQFYYRKADLVELRAPWSPEHSLYLLRQYQQHYLGGPEQPARAQPSPGRNAPCPCQSGKKYKRCCGLGPSASPDSDPTDL